MNHMKNDCFGWKNTFIFSLELLVKHNVLFNEFDELLFTQRVEFRGAAARRFFAHTLVPLDFF